MKILLLLLTLASGFALTAQSRVDQPLLRFSFENSTENSGTLSLQAQNTAEAPQYESSVSQDAGLAAFTSSTNRLSISTGFTQDLDSLTAAIWVRPNNVDSVGQFGTGRNVVFTQNGVALRNGLLELSFSDGLIGALPDGTNGTPLPARKGTWQHFSLIREADSNRVYLNGGTLARQPSNQVNSTVDPNPELIIGAGRRGTDQYYHGLMDEFRLYEASLQACEVADLYFQHAPDTSGKRAAQYNYNNNFTDISGQDVTSRNSNIALDDDRFGSPSSAARFASNNRSFQQLDLSIDTSARATTFWFNADASNFDSNREVAVLFTQDDASLEQGIWRVDIDAARDIPGTTARVLRLFAGGDTSRLEVPIEANRWYHVALVLDGPVAKYYLDGNWVGTRASNDYASTSRAYPNIVVGAGRARDNQFFDGLIDDLVVYNRTLTDCEVERLASLPSSTRNLTSVELTAYPNPTSDFLTLSGLPTNIASYHYVVQDLIGRRVISGTCKREIPVVELAPGIYTAELMGGKRRYITKFVKR